ncbi:hypothetical protein BV898_14147 [Hypsibius exemplaris]|uniref:Glycosyltransferase n=1 Tax=Hypsibius exemplaris TaxID=2072580 RepID=A0A1W0W8N6_HYPEX|nr:hypothetical protein BV898_14147 [Hypsibius exemplaris]
MKKLLRYLPIVFSLVLFCWFVQEILKPLSPDVAVDGVNVEPEQQPTAVAKDKPPLELILHYIKFKLDGADGINIRFLDYLSILSAVQRLKPDKIFVHADEEPQGTYWNELKSRGWVKYVYRKKVINVSGREGTLKNIWHIADKARVDILLEYGGLAVDFDVYFVRGERIRQIMQNHKAIACYEHKIAYNSGLFGASKGSRLLYAWHHSYDVIYRGNDWTFNSGDLLKFLSEIFPEEVYVVDHVCNNPFAWDIENFFLKTGHHHWTDSVAIHTYHRLHKGGLFDTEMADADGLKKSWPSDFRDILLTIYENRTLPEPDPMFSDRIAL